MDETNSKMAETGSNFFQNIERLENIRKEEEKRDFLEKIQTFENISSKIIESSSKCNLPKFVFWLSEKKRKECENSRREIIKTIVQEFKKE